MDSLVQGFIEIKNTLINDIPIRIYIPHNAEMSLHIGRVEKRDTSVIFTAQAADVRADNGGITIGVADNSPLFEQATEEGGYFFRQYPLVKDGQLIDNEPKSNL